MEVENTMHTPLRDDQDNILKFETKEKANIERIYLQPEYDNPLKVVGIE